MRGAYARHGHASDNSDNNHAMRATTAVLLVHAISACAGTAPAPARSSEAHTPLPALTLPRIAGGTWSSTSARGSVLVIDVWASWCKPCGRAFPKLEALAARRSDVAVVAISIDEDLVAARGFVAQFPIAGVTVAQDAEQVFTRPPLSVARLPTVLIVDADGVIRQRLEEPSEHDYDHLEELIARLAK